MGRPKKEYSALTVKMDKAVYERLVEYCEAAGQTKTVAVERAVSKFIDEYYEKESLLNESKQNQ